MACIFVLIISFTDICCKVFMHTDERIFFLVNIIHYADNAQVQSLSNNGSEVTNRQTVDTEARADLNKLFYGTRLSSVTAAPKRM